MNGFFDLGLKDAVQNVMVATKKNRTHSQIIYIKDYLDEEKCPEVLKDGISLTMLKKKTGVQRSLENFIMFLLVPYWEEVHYFAG